MAGRVYRIGVVGASSLAGKELSDELAESVLGASELELLDDDELAGQITAAGDEAAFIQRIDESSFEGLDFVFFAGEAATTRKHWAQARRSGASVVDLTYALEQERDALVQAPWVTDMFAAGNGEPDLRTPALIAAHPAAVMLALVAARLQASLRLMSVAATVMEPASEHGREAMDELHQQTVNLLSFHSLPQDQYDAQVSFNLLVSLGERAKVDLAETRRRIGNHYRALTSGVLPELALELVQAPVFHGYVASVLVELGATASVEQVEAALAGEHIEVADVRERQSEPLSNLSAAGQEDVIVGVRTATGEDGPATRFWLWLAADNLKLAALNGIACALALRRLRPLGKVQ
jgi:aspartate-semialdehyde dehydrogenase